MAFFKGCIIALIMLLISGMLLFINPSWPLAFIIIALVFCISRLAR